MNKARIIIDASVFAKWFLPDEKDREIALLIKEDYAKEYVAISLPSVTFYEVNNIFRSAVMRSRIGKEEAFERFSSFLKLDFIIYTMEDLQQKILEKAIKLDLSSYDASYVALAEYLDVYFYTADERLVKKAKNKLVLSLKNYPKEG